MFKKQLMHSKILLNLLHINIKKIFFKSFLYLLKATYGYESFAVRELTILEIQKISRMYREGRLCTIRDNMYGLQGYV